MKLPRRGSVVVVTWRDSEVVTGWVDPDHAPAQHLIETRGRFLGPGATIDTVRIAPTCAVVDGNIIQCLGLVIIPRGAIVDLEVV